jgi:hypothetical protein
VLGTIDSQVVGGPHERHGQSQDRCLVDQVGEAIDDPSRVVLEGGGIGKVQQGFVFDLPVVVEAGFDLLGVDFREAFVPLGFK